MNTQAIEQARLMAASKVSFALEDDLKNLKTLSAKSSLPLTMVVYQDVPLFTSADCIRSNPCKDCSRGEKWIPLERNGIKYQALSKNCQIMLFTDKPFCVAQEAEAVAADFYRVDFCYKKYTSDKAARIFDAVKNFADVPECHKANFIRPNLL